MGMKDQLQKGFYLENSNTLLEWNTPLEQLAQKTGGFLNSDRFYWTQSTFLSGLQYLLSSENGVPMDAPFKTILAYVGLNSEGLWEDHLSLEGFDTISAHLIKLFGEPYEVVPRNDNGEKSQSWKVGKVTIRLSIIEHFALKCFLIISIE